MATVRFFGPAREAAGEPSTGAEGATVAEVLTDLRRRYDEPFGEVLAISKVWVNGEPAELGDPVAATDELSVLPPVSGG